MKQRPLQTILKRKQMLKEPPVKEPKVINEAKPFKGPAKTAVSDASSTGSSRKPEKPEEEQKPPPLPVPLVPHQGGHYELNARMTKMVEAELRDIMIKVWQELPDHPNDDAEALVIDKLRNKAGDDLRNVLGLNITKRLLNVHNPLYVRVQFSGKPEKVHLAEFLKKYNFNAFRRIENTVNMFAAQVRTINDFDNICSIKDIRCGEIKVTVNPIYKFTRCPANLITSFIDQDDDASEETIAEISEKDDKSETKTEHVKTSEKLIAKQSESTAPKSKEPSKTETITQVEKIVSKTDENKIVDRKSAADNTLAVVNKTVESKAVVEKPALKPAVENKALVSDNKPPVNKPAVEQPTTKPVVENKKSIESKPASSKPSIEENKIVIIKPPIANKTVASKPAVNTKPAVNKPTVDSKEVNKPPIGTKNSNVPKKPIPSPVKTKSDDKTVKGKASKTKAESDNDELDDYDILALMSEGIILDECCGSDED